MECRGVRGMEKEKIDRLDEEGYEGEEVGGGRG